jgi:hypothetical protein
MKINRTDIRKNPCGFQLILFLMALFLLRLDGLNRLLAQDVNQHHPEKTIKAVRIDRTVPKIDGVLDDPVWRQAPISEGFMQRDPTEGDSASERTTIQMAYDDEALYIGVMCYDREPAKIAARLSRRDVGVESDWVSVEIDPHHDHQTGNYFQVNAAGVLYDGQEYNDGYGDGSWDGVWQGKAKVQ